MDLKLQNVLSRKMDLALISPVFRKVLRLTLNIHIENVDFNRIDFIAI